MFCLAPLAILSADELVQLIDRPARVSILPPGINGWPRIGGDYFNQTSAPPVLTLQFSADLKEWRRDALLLQAPFQFTDPTPRSSSQGFHRLLVEPRAETNDWANQLVFPSDPLFNGGACGMDLLQWAKFAIVLEDPYRVYFQDSGKFLLHVEFATNRLARFRGLTPEAFNAVALHTAAQQIVLGTIIAPLVDNGEYAIQFSGFDPYPPDTVVRWFELVRSAVGRDGDRAYYLPAYEQLASAEDHRAYFLAHGIEVIAATRWSSGTTVCYSSGWAVGRLRFVSAAEIPAAFADGRLTSADILLTDGVPAEVPYLTGIISLAPATPNSHVAILAQSYSVPFVYVSGANEQERLLNLVGRMVAFRTGTRLANCQVLITDVEGSLDPALTNYLTQLKAPAQIDVPAKSHFGALSVDAASLVPSDIRFFGGKASNFGLLRRILPDHSPEAIAFSFDLWDTFLDQTLTGGETLRQAIRSRLGEFVFPPDIAMLRLKLSEVRSLIRNVAQFSPAQREQIIAALSRFDRRRNIRFRSSTNVEDAERFSGAGLYDSFSGCMEDDLDGDSAGPSACDPTETDERGVFRAIQRVYASFYNENAFLERLRFGINEDQVGMALLVHHSTPDQFELANGVATLTVTRAGASAFTSGQLVTQLGAVSISNPDRTAQPEVTGFFWSSSFTNVEPRTASSLVPFGTRVLAPEEYPQLIGLLGLAAAEYLRPLTDRNQVMLDFEYKKEAPDRLSIKQIREVPSIGGTNPVSTFGLTATVQNFYPWGDVFAVHRLKSSWTLAPRSTLFDAGRLAASLYTTSRVELLEGSDARTLVGDPATWPAASHTAITTNNSWTIEDRFALGAGDERRRFTLSVRWPTTVSSAECPWVTLADAQLQLSAAYAKSMPTLELGGQPVFLDAESVSLLPPHLDDTTNSVGLTVTNRTIRLFSTQRVVQLIGPPADGVPEDSRCLVIGPKSSFGRLSVEGETRIDGLLPDPLTLIGRYAQTFLERGRYGHETIHELVCDPWLEPTLTTAQKAGLTAANVRLFYYYHYQFGDVTERFLILGLDGTFRAVP